MAMNARQIAVLAEIDLQHVDRAAPQAIPVKLKFLNERLHERKIAPLRFPTF
jgi:hypothetical protein